MKAGLRRRKRSRRKRRASRRKIRVLREIETFGGLTVASVLIAAIELTIQWNKVSPGVNQLETASQLIPLFLVIALILTFLYDLRHGVRVQQEGTSLGGSDDGRDPGARPRSPSPSPGWIRGLQTAPLLQEFPCRRRVLRFPLILPSRSRLRSPLIRRPRILRLRLRHPGALPIPSHRVQVLEAPTLRPQVLVREVRIHLRQALLNGARVLRDLLPDRGVLSNRLLAPSHLDRHETAKAVLLINQALAHRLLLQREVE
ncbi:hypothetical protein VTJ04DRAFT_8162 [Mycothermus thermophilus]|uniref:uncharacterized protein n=1 Tax=Humicola insolens TaxID=85995 RepID=UPI0037431A4F